MKRLAPFVIAASACTFPGTARASPDYGTDIRAALELTYTPACTLCHEAADPDAGDAGSDAVTEPFGKSLVRKGLRGADPASLRSALDRIRADGTDSDGDGAEDLDELSWGGDPNVPSASGDPHVEPLHYGCSLAPFERPRRDECFVIAALIPALLRRSRRRTILGLS